MQNLTNLIESRGRLPSRTLIEQEIIRRATERSLSSGHDSARSRCKTLSGFVREAWPILEPRTPYMHNWHVDLVCKHLEAITFGKFGEFGLRPRVVFNQPPGTMKSLLVSVFWGAWEWGPAGMPWLRYLTTSFADENVSRDCRKMRDLVESEWFQALWPIELTKRGETNFENTMKGGREGRAFPSLTGGRGDRLIIDDPHSTEQVESDADRARAIRIFRESVPSRINQESSAIVVMMHRLHQHDVTGVALALNLGYTHVMLPMEFESDRACVTPFGSDPRKRDGDLMFPERFSAKTVEADKSTMGQHAVAAQFQQRPSPRGGLMFKRAWFNVVQAAPVDCQWVRAWDLASTGAKHKNTSMGPAYTAGVKLGRDAQGRFYIAHVVRIREEGAAVRRMIANVASIDGKNCIIDLPQDPGQAGKVQKQDLIAMLAGYEAYGSPEEGDKINRALPVAAQAEAGNFSVVEGPWNEDFFGELELFPTGSYKDQVDALSRAFARFVRSTAYNATGLYGPILVTQPRAYFGYESSGGETPWG